MPYPDFMKLQVASFVLLPILALTAAFTVSHANAQVRVPRTPILLLADYHLIHGSEYTYRFNSKTGSTQRLVITTTNGTGLNAHYVWNDVGETAPAPAAGDTGRYDVVEGNGDGAALVRIDKSSGRTWAMVPATVLLWKQVSTN